MARALFIKKKCNKIFNFYICDPFCQVFFERSKNTILHHFGVSVIIRFSKVNEITELNKKEAREG